MLETISVLTDFSFRWIIDLRAYLALPCCQERFLLCCVVVVCRGKECVVAVAVGQCCSWGTVELSWGSFTCDVDVVFLFRTDIRG